MKIFYTPAIDGEFKESARRRMMDQPDKDVYDRLDELDAQDSIDLLDSRGYVKILSRDSDGKVVGYFTYQQDEL